MRQNLTVPNLAAHERAFDLDTGETVAVSVTRGEQTEEYVAVRIVPRVVDPATGETICKCQGEVATILTGVLAQGAETLEALVSDKVQALAEKARRVRVARDAFFRLPGEG